MTEAVQLPVFSSAGDPLEKMSVPEAIAGVPNSHVVYLAVVRQLANARVGSASTKTKGEVRGGGRKPWRQKHTGRARQGSIRAPQWPGGGIVFGPRPRSYGQDMPAGVRTVAFRSVLAERARQGRLAILDGIALDSAKTKHACAFLKKLSFEKGVLFVTKGPEPEIKRAFRNIPGVRVERAEGVSLYDLLKFGHVAVVRDAFDELLKRCG